MIATAQLEAWLRDLDPEVAGHALVGLGIDVADLGRIRGSYALGKRPPVIRWRVSEAQFRHRTAVDPQRLAVELPGSVRLGVETDAAPEEVVRRLLDVPNVASAFVSVRRPAHALRRRRWRWPLRVGLLGFPPSAAGAVLAGVREQHAYLPAMLDVHRTEEDPSAVDVVVVAGPVVEAVARLAHTRIVANAVVVLDRPLERVPVVDAQLATARAATGAVASALVGPVELADLLAELVDAAARAEPFDVALTRAAGSDLLLFAEPGGLTRATVPEIARETAAALARAGSSVVVPPPLGAAGAALAIAAAGSFHEPAVEALNVARLTETVEPALDELDQARWCQARVGEGEDNLVRAGRNRVRVFIGPREEDALSTQEPFDEEGLPWQEEDAEAFRLTVAFVPAVPDPVPQQAELDLPRFGRSSEACFAFEVAEGSDGAAARIVVLFRNRVLQTAVLRGRVGAPAELTELTGVVPTLAGLDERSAFDVALVANHADGVPLLIRHSDGTTLASSANGVPAAAERIANRLAREANRRSPTSDLRSPATVRRLIELAVAGHDLFQQLEQELGPLSAAARIQVVSARADALLPIELMYERWSPVPSAKICERYLADPRDCDGTCTPVEDRSVLCPNAFWGLGKTIERHRYDWEVDRDLDPHGGNLLHVPDRPRPGRRDLTIRRVRLGASGRVGEDDVADTVRQIGCDARAVTSWDDWTSQLAEADTELLILLPHTDVANARLEIARAWLDRSFIEGPYVTGGRSVKPIVLLFGCRTGGTAGDPAGFASVFMRAGAATAFHSCTDLRNVHATALARRLAHELLQASPSPRTLSDVLTAFRREAVHDGAIVALAISAFGDADWSV